MRRETARLRDGLRMAPAHLAVREPYSFDERAAAATRVRSLAPLFLTASAVRGKSPSPARLRGACRTRSRDPVASRGDLVWGFLCQALALSHCTLSSSAVATTLSFDRPAPIDNQDQAASAGRRTTQDSPRRACQEWRRSAPQPCIRWSSVWAPNHDAVIRISGEAPRRADPFSPKAL
jgi:hypothetical protein